MVARKLVQERNIGSYHNLCVAMNAQKKNNDRKACYPCYIQDYLIQKSPDITPCITCLNTDIANMNFHLTKQSSKVSGEHVSVLPTQRIDNETALYIAFQSQYQVLNQSQYKPIQLIFLVLVCSRACRVNSIPRKS